MLSFQNSPWSIDVYGGILPSHPRLDNAVPIRPETFLPSKHITNGEVKR